MFDLTKCNAMIQTMDLSMSLASKRQTLIASNLRTWTRPATGPGIHFEGHEICPCWAKNHPIHLVTTNPCICRKHPRVPPANHHAFSPVPSATDANDVSLDGRHAYARTRSTTSLLHIHAVELAEALFDHPEGTRTMSISQIFDIASTGMAGPAAAGSSSCLQRGQPVNHSTREGGPYRRRDAVFQTQDLGFSGALANAGVRVASSRPARSLPDAL